MIWMMMMMMVWMTILSMITLPRRKQNQQAKSLVYTHLYLQRKNEAIAVGRRNVDASLSE
jgi:hypothetical protein